MANTQARLTSTGVQLTTSIYTNISRHINLLSHDMRDTYATPEANRTYEIVLNFFNDLDIRYINQYAKSVNMEEITLEMISNLHLNLIRQVYKNYLEFGPDNPNVKLYVVMSKISILYETYKSAYNRKRQNEVQSPVSSAETAPTSPSSVSIEPLYANFFPLSELEEVQASTLRNKESPFLENFLRTHGDDRVRQITRIPVRKIDNSNEYDIDNGLLQKISDFIDSQKK